MNKPYYATDGLTIDSASKYSAEIVANLLNKYKAHGYKLRDIIEIEKNWGNDNNQRNNYLECVFIFELEDPVYEAL